MMKKGQRAAIKPTRSRATPKPKWTVANWTKKDTDFVFRFSGFSRAPRTGDCAKAYHVVGIGHLTLTADGKLKGRQKSTSIPLQGSEPKFDNEAFLLEGTYGLEADGSGTAIIDFSIVVGGSAGAVVLRGGFDLVFQGDLKSPKTIWLISSRTTDLNPKDPDYKMDVDELVSGEAVAV